MSVRFSAEMCEFQMLEIDYLTSTNGQASRASYAFYVPACQAISDISPHCTTIHHNISGSVVAQKLCVGHWYAELLPCGGILRLGEDVFFDLVDPVQVAGIQVTRGDYQAAWLEKDGGDWKGINYAALPVCGCGLLLSDGTLRVRVPVSIIVE